MAFLTRLTLVLHALLTLAKEGNDEDSENDEQEISLMRQRINLVREARAETEPTP